MSIKSIVLFAGAALGHTIFSRDTKFGCGTPDPTEEQLEISRQFAVKEAANRESGLQAQRAFSVNVYLHSVAANESTLLEVSFISSVSLRAVRLTSTGLRSPGAI